MSRRGAPGFTLIETLVAIVILATAIATTLSLASQGFKSADIGGDQITASFLAQDALEYVRLARDSASLNDQPWLAYLVNCTTSNGCYFDSSQALDMGSGNNPKPCPGSGCPVMNFNPNSGFYNYAPVINNSNVTGDNPDSKFTRTVNIINPSGGLDDEAKVLIEVSWATRGQVRTVKLQEDIYKWQ
jgi:prepilin-type N-terminal cleavage/methylation domain-containing protein